MGVPGAAVQARRCEARAYKNPSAYSRGSQREARGGARSERETRAAELIQK